MRAIKLCFDDPDIYGTKVTLDRCDFVQNHFESFMQMYKTQGSTFWLRFLISFKSYIEKKFASSKKWMAILINHFQFIKVLNYMYISIHKKIIEGSNTSVKKFINNLIILAKNSPSYLKLDLIEWTAHLKSSKQLQNVFQNLFGLPDPSEYNGFTAFVYTIYADFFCALCSVFEQWYSASDLTEEELKKIDSKIIYWLPNIDIENKKNKPMCFEKYISIYWKEDLQRMLLTDNVHNYFSSHKKAGCCDKFEKEKNIFHLFHFSAKNDLNLMKIICEEMGISTPDDQGQTITDVSLKDLCILKPQIEYCDKHENCYVRICHDPGCLEPFTCSGASPCVITCESTLKSRDKKEGKNGKFWKNISIEIFDIDANKRDVSTLAESSDRDIETYLHVRGVIDIDFPLSMLRNYSYCLTEWHNFDYNHRKIECLNRLRKKLSQKNPSNSLHINRDALKQSFYRETLLEDARAKMMKLEHQYCTSKDHIPSKCSGDCFLRDMYTVAINSSDAFGRVVFLSKTSFSIPPVLSAEAIAANSCVNKKCDIRKRSDSKKSSKSSIDEKEISNCNENSLANRSDPLGQEVCGNMQVCSDVHNPKSKGNLQNEMFKVNDKPRDSYINDNPDEDEVDEILKLIGILEHKKDSDENEIGSMDMKKEKSENLMMEDVVSNEDKAVDNFFKLIGVKDNSSSVEVAAEKNGFEAAADKCISEPVKCDKKIKLRICAYCQKKETERKTFKRCSKCKEENFPVHRYYCSRECLIEDWTESHQAEHLKIQKFSA